MSTITERALDAMPGYREQGLAKLLRVERNTRRPESDAASVVHARILELAAAGSPIPFDVAAPVLEQTRAHELWIARREAIDKAIEAVQTDVVDVTRTHGDAALAVLHGELQKVADAVRELASKLGHVRTGDQAIEHGVVPAYKQILELVSDYDEIRTLQRTILEKQDKDEHLHVRPFTHSGLLADAVSAHPHWGQKRSDAAYQSTATDDREEAFLAWLNAGSAITSGYSHAERALLDRSWWPSTDPAAKIGYLIRVSTEARLWVPSMRKLRLADRLANEASSYFTQSSRSVGIDFNLRALGALCELTGTPWPSNLSTPMSPEERHNRRTGANVPVPQWSPAVELEQRLALV